MPAAAEGLTGNEQSSLTTVRLACTCVCLLTAQCVLAQDHSESRTDYGEIQVLIDYEDSSEKLGHISFGRIGASLNTYLDRKARWTSKSGFSWLIEVAPIFQKHIDSGGGSNANNETNLIAQWSIVDPQDSGRGSIIAWYQFADTWGNRTTSDLMEIMGVLSPPNGGDTAPASSRDLTQHFAWEQKFVGDRLRVQVGKLTTRVLFNLNRYAVSDREDFFTPMIVNNPVAHYTARVGFGTFVEYKQPGWYLSGMVRDADADLSKRFVDFDSLSTGNWEYVAEAALTPGDVAGLGQGVYRVTVSRSDRTETVDSTSSVSFSFDQDLGERYGAFFRLAMSDDTFRAFERRMSAGVQVKKPFGFANDRIGAAAWWGDPSDSALRSETGIDLFWKFQIARFMEVSLGAQVVLDPALDEDRSRATTAALRFRLLL